MTNQSDLGERPTFTELGGSEMFTKLTAEFYARVATDDLMRPMYPEDDLGPAERRLRMFLEQYWGGPRTYSEERGHPRLRMRHAPYVIDATGRDRWLAHMAAAMDTVPLSESARAHLWAYFVHAANFMINAAEPAAE